MKKKLLTLFLVSGGLLIGSFASAAYCVRDTGAPGVGAQITRVLLTGADITLDNVTTNSTNSPTFLDYFSGLTAPTLITGQSYSITVKVGTGNELAGIGVWIDFNGNEVFDTGADLVGETYNLGANGTATYSFTVPMTGTIGTTRLRITVAFDAQATLPGGVVMPCGTTAVNGETEDYNVTLAASYTAPASAGEGRRIIPIDNCPQGDTSPTMYDSLCSGMSPLNGGVLADGTVKPNATIIATVTIQPTPTVTPPASTGGTSEPTLPQEEKPVVWMDPQVCSDAEMEEAFLFGRAHAITTMASCMKARMDGNLTRGEAAKMISTFAINILSKQADTSTKCEFSDMTNADAETKEYATLACQLGLMGRNGDGSVAATFSANELVNKAQFATIISRLLFGSENNSSDTCWYCKHAAALKAEGIIKVTTDLMEPLKRGYAILMLMRINK